MTDPSLIQYVAEYVDETIPETSLLLHLSVNYPGTEIETSLQCLVSAWDCNSFIFSYIAKDRNHIEFVRRLYSSNWSLYYGITIPYHNTLIEDPPIHTCFDFDFDPFEPAVRRSSWENFFIFFRLGD